MQIKGNEKSMYEVAKFCNIIGVSKNKIVDYINYFEVEGLKIDFDYDEITFSWN